MKQNALAQVLSLHIHTRLCISLVRKTDAGYNRVTQERERESIREKSETGHARSRVQPLPANEKYNNAVLYKKFEFPASSVFII